MATLLVSCSTEQTSRSHAPKRRQVINSHTFVPLFIIVFYRQIKRISAVNRSRIYALYLSCSHLPALSRALNRWTAIKCWATFFRRAMSFKPLRSCCFHALRLHNNLAGSRQPTAETTSRQSSSPALTCALIWLKCFLLVNLDF